MRPRRQYLFDDIYGILKIDIRLARKTYHDIGSHSQVLYSGNGFADYLFGLANRRNRLIALVRVATEISAAQKSRLATAIEKQVGQPISINVQVDPSIIGGVSIKFADDLVDGSISNRLASAGRALVGQN